MRISASVVLASFTLMSCDQVILRQPSLGQPNTRVMAEDVNYEVTVVPLSPDVVSRANQSHFRQLVEVGGSRGAPVRFVEPSDAIQRNAPPLNQNFDYVLGIGDVLILNRTSLSFDEDNRAREVVISTTLQVASSGFVSLEDGQQILAAGLTLEQLRREIAAEMLGTNFQLSIREFNSQIVTFKSVQTNTTGEIVLDQRGLDLRRFLSRLPIELSKERDIVVRLYRNNKQYRITAQEILFDSPSNRYRLMADDHIILEELIYAQNTALIIGSVGRPFRLALEPTQRVTLSAALFDGPSQPTVRSDFGHIYVIRGQQPEFTAFHLDLRDVLRAGLAEKFELRPNDIIFIRTHPITKFNEAVRMALGLVSSVEAVVSTVEGL